MVSRPVSTRTHLVLTGRRTAHVTTGHRWPTGVHVLAVYAAPAEDLRQRNRLQQYHRDFYSYILLLFFCFSYLLHDFFHFYLNDVLNSYSLLSSVSRQPPPPPVIVTSSKLEKREDEKHVFVFAEML